jgi:hypothetical protein
VNFPQIRKIISYLDETQKEQGETLRPVLRKVAAGAVVSNPFAGRFSRDLAPLPAFGAELAEILTERVLAQLGGAGEVQSYGKAAIVGIEGEIEHAAAVLHPRFGRIVRSLIPHAKSIMPSAVKRAAAGATLDTPLHHVVDEWSFDHFDAVSISVEDAPAADELLIVLGVANGGRPLARLRRDE